jgi:hypothetical protein
MDPRRPKLTPLATWADRNDEDNARRRAEAEFQASIEGTTDPASPDQPTRARRSVAYRIAVLVRRIRGE